MSVPMRWQEPEKPQEPIQLVVLPQRRRVSRRVLRARRLRAVCVVVAFCMCAAVATRLAASLLPRDHGLRLLRSGVSGGHVVLCGASVERNLGFVTVTGNVANTSRKPLGKIEAVVELTDAENNTLAIESALLPLDPLRVGEKTPFRVEMQDHPRAVSYRVHFRHLLGNSLD